MGTVAIYAPGAEDFSSNGLGLLLPTECTVKEQANGMYELTLVHPITGDLRWTQIQNGCILKANVPMRESPLYEIEAFEGVETSTTTVTRKLYRVDVNTRLRLRAKPSTSSKILGRYKNGTQVIRLKDMGDGWYKVSVKKGGATGYMYAAYLDYVKDITETVTTTKPVTRDGVTVSPSREQLFRISSVEVDTDKHVVTATAMHIFYDLRGNPLGKAYSPSNADANTAAQTIFDGALMAHDFELSSHLTGTVTAEYGYRGVTECLLDPDEGILAQTGGVLVRDNYDVFLLPAETRDMGVTIRRGKNLIGVQVTTDNADVVTRIIPVGRNSKGDDLFLDGTIYVDSPYIDQYPVVYARRIDYDVTVGDGDGEYSTNAKARAELRKRAQADFDSGVDMPAYGMEVDFITLQDTAEYAEYASLQAVNIHDTVTVIDELINLRAKLRVTGYEWDALAEKYDSVTLGELVALEQVTYGYTLAEYSVSGSKIIPGSVGGGALRSATIQYAKIAQAAIDQLAANAITAVRAHINELVAGSVTADELYANLATIAALEVANAEIDYAQIKDLTAEVARIADAQIESATITTAQIQNLNAFIAEIADARIGNATIKSAQIDDLQAVMLQAITANISTASIDYAQIRDLLADQAIITDGVGKSLLIERLFVTQANMLGATLGQLILKGSDGNYYKVVVQSDGTISTEPVSVTDGEITAGQTGGGLQIVETDMNVASLNAQNIRAQSAIIAEIFTQALTAGKITAAEALIASATIPVLYATAIQSIGGSLDLSANESIKLLVGRKNATLYREEEPAEFNSGDTWIRPSDGKTFLARGMTGKNAPELVIGEDFMLSYRFGDDADEYALMMDEDGNLLATDANAQITEEGDLEATAVWMEIAPSELHTSFIDILQDMIVIHSGGNVNINAGGALNVNSGAAHFRTGEYTLSILANDGTEDTVMDFDAEGKTLRVSELKAGNVRPFIAGTTEVTSASVGGLDGLKGLLESAQYEHIVYTQTSGDTSSEPVQINGCDSLQVDVVAAMATRVPPLAFTRATGNVYMENLVWNCAGQTAMTADSGSFVLRDCRATAGTGAKAVRNARIVWIGADDTATDGGTCATAFEATEGGEIRAFGLIPTGGLVQNLAGTVTVTDGSTGDGGTTEEEEQTVTLTGTLGYYGTTNGWNSGVMYQGYSNGKGRIYGCMKFTLPEGATAIKAATLTLRRVSGAGSGSNINVSVYGSATAYGSRPTLGSLYAEREKAAATGASCTLDVTQAAQALADGTAKQLVLWTGETAAASGVVYSRHYGKFDSAKLKITY